jgi:xylose dehydrogenase (NAD/NADP)
MEKNILNWGLLSTARINQALIPPLRASKRNKLVGIASRSKEKAATYARQWDIPQAFGSYESLLANPSIDVVYISLPNSMHTEWAIKAMQAGKHVLCEKPLTIALEEVDAISGVAAETGMVVAEAFMYRHHAQTLRIKEMVDTGAIGKVQLIRGAFSYSLNNKSDVRYNLNMGGGSIWDVGCYPINYARYLLGVEPLEVQGWQMTGTTGIDEVFVGQLRFPGDVFAQFDSSFRMPFRSFIEIIGREGKMNIPAPFKPENKDLIQLTHGGKVKTFNAAKAQQGDLYQSEIEDMADAILLGKQTRVSLQDSRGNIATILALLESARQDRPIPL